MRQTFHEKRRNEIEVGKRKRAFRERQEKERTPMPGPVPMLIRPSRMA